jgi:phage baseplate assembly protein W
MANGITYGIAFPFVDSFTGRYLDVTNSTEAETRASLVHLILTRKGSRYFLPNFGTRLYEFIFEPLDGPTFSDIESEIRDTVRTYMPNLQITNVTVEPGSAGLEDKGYTVNQYGEREFSVPNIAQLEHTAKIKIDYRITDSAFESQDFIIINI